MILHSLRLSSKVLLLKRLLPPMEYLPEKNSSGSYRNETEQNIHIWCSIVIGSTAEGYSGQATLGLVAGDKTYSYNVYFIHLLDFVLGCYVRNWLPVSVFYKWLDLILISPAWGQSQANFSQLHSMTPFCTSS